MRRPKILIVDDEPDICDQIVRWLNSEDYSADVAHTGQQTLSMLANYEYPVVLLDIKLPDISGFDILKQIRQRYPDTCPIMITAFIDLAMSEQAMQIGAFDFLIKPINFNELLPRIKNALARFNENREREFETEDQQRRYSFGNIIGESPVMQQMHRTIRRIAGSDETVLILGETGTGKELVAKAIHYNSLRRNKKMMVTDCSTLAQSLIESELFGHEKGAFTGADNKKIGRFERAHGTTLFFDEIGELTIDMQMKLLRFLQERTIERVGGTEVIHIDTRVIAATAVDLKKAIQKARFRKDLFQRLNVVTINIPPLRERLSDVPLLVKHFIQRYSLNSAVKGISDRALDMLMRYHFPGNVRELENIIRRAIVTTDNEILQPADITFDTIEESNLFNGELFDRSLEMFMDLCEMEYLKHLMIRFNNQKRKASEFAGIDRTTLYSKLKKYGLQNNGE